MTENKGGHPVGPEGRLVGVHVRVSQRRRAWLIAQGGKGSEIVRESLDATHPLSEPPAAQPVLQEQEPSKS
jgi:hypothetical protein